MSYFNALLFAGLALTLVNANAGQIIWGSAAGERNLTSKQDLPLNAGFTFELGSFRSGFKPTRENSADWVNHWISADRSSYQESLHYFGGDYALQNNDASGTNGEQGYIWGYDQQSNSGEWLLITNPETWIWPEVNEFEFPLHWSVSNASHAIVGSINAPNAHYYFRTESISMKKPPLDDSHLWLTLHFSEEQRANSVVSSWTSDPDGDGLSNLEEYAFGFNPLSQTASPGSVRMIDGQTEYRWPMIESVHVETRVEISNNLVHWIETGSSPTAGENGVMTWRDNLEQTQFVRLRLNLTQTETP